MLCVQSLVEIGPVVLEKKEDYFLNFVNVFLLFPHLLPLEKGMARHLNKFGCFVSSFVEIGMVLLLKMKMWKVYDNNDNVNGQRTNFDQKNSLELLAQVS